MEYYTGLPGWGYGEARLLASDERWSYGRWRSVALRWVFMKSYTYVLYDKLYSESTTNRSSGACV